MNALYNEVEPFACAWLERLIERGHIGPGQVDRRSIVDLTPADVAGPGQRHFFAGIGGWSYALRLAGVPDDADVWTGSCPCQPFSSAGSRQGFDDPRHLWPAWFALIRECRPATIFGEQVAGPDGLAWLDVVQSDLEGCGYAFGAAVLSAAGVGAPHQRHRIYFVACADESDVGQSVHVLARGPRCEMSNAQRSGTDRSVGNAAARERGSKRESARAAKRREPGAASGAGRLEHTSSERSGGHSRADDCSQGASTGPGVLTRSFGDELVTSSTDGVMAQSTGSGPQGTGGTGGTRVQGRGSGSADAGAPVLWADAEWIPCRDPERGIVYRPVEPGTFPLAHGVPARVGRLRGYGNAIVTEVAACFIKAAIAARGGLK